LVKSATKKEVVVIIGVCFLFIIYLVPFIWIFITSIKPEPLIAKSPPVFLFKPTFQHYFELHARWDFFKKMLNSLIIAGGTTALCIGISVLTAYSIARYRKGGNLLPLWMLSHRFLPVAATLLPLFLFYRRIGLEDTHLGQILANAVPNLAFSIWLLAGFFADIPSELDEAAKVDGCGLFMILWRIIIPVAKPAIAVTAIFVFLFTWNEFFIPLVLSQRASVPVTIAFAGFKGHMEMEWGSMGAASTICLFPLLAIIRLLSRHVVRGMTLGAVKE